MAPILPGTQADWEDAIENRNISVGLLSSGHAFQSGSNFSEEDFLRLRILHTISHPNFLYSAHLPKASVQNTSKIFNESKEIQALRELLLTSRSISEWTHGDSERANRFAVGLEHLSIIATSSNSEDSEKEASHGTISSRIINSPRIRKPPAHLAKINTDLPSQLSRLNLEPQTPPNKSRSPSADDWLSPIPFPSASTAPSIPSPKNQDLQEAIDSYKREMLEVTGHEQTVNACLIDLIIPVSSILGSSGRVRFDRKPFQVLKKNATDGKALYEAQVDGLIMGRNGKDVQAFIEAKRDLRAGKKEVRLQEGAQMAAFIYSKGRTNKATRYEGALCFAGYERQ